MSIRRTLRVVPETILPVILHRAFGSSIHDFFLQSLTLGHASSEWTIPKGAIDLLPTTSGIFYTNLVDFFFVYRQWGCVSGLSGALSLDLGFITPASWPRPRLLTWILCTSFRCIDLRAYHARPYAKCVSFTNYASPVKILRYLIEIFKATNGPWKLLRMSRNVPIWNYGGIKYSMGWMYY